MFLRSLCLRPSCYNCQAKSIRFADITLADLWGAEKLAPEFFNNHGTSLIIIRTENGNNAIEKVADNICRKEITYEDAVSHNTMEFKSIVKPAERNAFFTDMNNMGFDELSNKYIYNTYKKKVKKILLDMGVWSIARKLMRT